MIVCIKVVSGKVTCFALPKYLCKPFTELVCAYYLHIICTYHFIFALQPHINIALPKLLQESILDILDILYFLSKFSKGPVE